MKTIAISISRGLVVRNILKTNVFKLLRDRGEIKFIFLVLDKAAADFRKDFFGTDIEIIPIASPKTGRWKSRFLQIFSRNLVWTESSKILSFVGKFSDKDRESFAYKIIFNTVGFLGKFDFVIRFYRFLDKHIFPEYGYDEIFRRNKIDLLFLPDIQGKIDTALLKSAKRFGIRSVAMTRGWDSLCQRLLRVLPDKIIVQSEPVKRDALKYQRLPESRIFISGFPQFDFYHNKDWLLSRAEYCRRTGLDPARKILFFGSSGAWTSRDSLTMQTVYKLVCDDKFIKPCSLILRPHFSNVIHKPYRDFYNLPNVYVDDKYTLSNFIDNWNPTDEDNQMLVNTLHHADVLIAYFSTLVLDAAAIDKPIINLVFGGQYDRNGRDVTWRLFQRTHYQPIVKTGGVRLAHNPDELVEAINAYLANPSLDSRGRKLLRDYWCYGADGQSGARIANYLLNEL